MHKLLVFIPVSGLVNRYPGFECCFPVFYWCDNDSHDTRVTRDCEWYTVCPAEQCQPGVSASVYRFEILQFGNITILRFYNYKILSF